MGMKIIITVIYMCICVVSVGELIERTYCPSTEAEWKNRSIELCKSQPQNYHCMYNRDCQLVEFCAKAKYNNFQIYLIDPGQLFLIERQNKMYTNSTEYSIIQYNIYCKPKITSTTGQPSTTVDNRENTIYETLCDYYVGWILFVLSLVVVGFFIYFTCIRKGNSETPTETVTQRQTGVREKCLTPVLEETPVQGRTDRMYFNATLSESNNSQNSDTCITEILTN